MITIMETVMLVVNQIRNRINQLFFNDVSINDQSDDDKRLFGECRCCGNFSWDLIPDDSYGQLCKGCY